MNKGSILFTGTSGRQYSFLVWSLDTRFKPLGGVYFIVAAKRVRGMRLVGKVKRAKAAAHAAPAVLTNRR